MIENKKIRILSALGIILIAAGHLELDYFTLGGLFPYYSFHVYIFLFVSGYFYQTDDEKHIGKFILRKTKKLLLPYFCWNLVYGLLSLLLRNFDIMIGQEPSLRTLFVEPFLGGHQFMFNFPAWFVPALFVVEVINVTGRALVGAIVSKLKGGNVAGKVDLIMGTGSLLAGIATVYLAMGGHVWGYWKTPGRFLIMLPGIYLGRAYQKAIEPFINNVIKKKFGKAGYYILYFGVILAVQLVMVNTLENLSFSTVWCQNFASTCVGPFLSVTTGVLFFLGIAELISEFKTSIGTKISSFFTLIGRETFGIMMHHMFVLFLINSVCFFVFKNNLGAEGFDTLEYSTNVSYQYLYAGYHATHIINLVLVVMVPSLIYGFIHSKKVNKPR